MKNSVEILAFLKAHKRKDPTYDRTAKGISDALGKPTVWVTKKLCELKKVGYIAPNPSRMLVGKHPNGPLRGGWRSSAYDITEAGIEWLEVRQ